METRLFNRLAGVPLSGFSLAGASGFEGGEIPHDAPMAMPIQTLRRRDYEPAPGSVGRQGGRALALVAATLALTGPATFALWSALGVNSLGLLDLLILLAFTPLFAWTAFSFASALAGLLAPPSDAVCLGLDPRTPARRPDSRTAILMPVYNEAPAPVFARLQAMFTSLRAAGGGGAFDFFVLSDSTDSDIQAEEHAHFLALRRRLGARARVYYRHRPINTDRKAGNIANWVRRFGGAYDFMVTLDADSLMEGETLMRLATAMEANPGVGTHPDDPRGGQSP